MSIAELRIHQLRNISSAYLKFNPKINCISGENGSGKSSLLEAIYLLATGHSFRSRETKALIQQGTDSFTVFAHCYSEDSLSIQKRLSGETLVKINQSFCKSSSELARFMPCQVIYQDIFQIIDAGPAVRRSLLDWGLFHVKHSYHGIWKTYRDTLKQRNALLRQKKPNSYLMPWNEILSNLADELDNLRSDYLSSWRSKFAEQVEKLTSVDCELQYYRGWDRKETGKSLYAVLEEQYESDLQKQYTQSGPHQADLLIKLPNTEKAKQHLSRGQQKMVLIALKLSQAELLEKPCVYLFDDLAAELDNNHLQRLYAQFELVQGQIFITMIEKNQSVLKNQSLEHKSFFIKNGKISDCD